MSDKQLIEIGLSDPKLYKRSVWRSAEKKMEALLKKTQLIEKIDIFGGPKYRVTAPLTNELINKLISL